MIAFDSWNTPGLCGGFFYKGMIVVAQKVHHNQSEVGGTQMRMVGYVSRVSFLSTYMKFTAHDTLKKRIRASSQGMWLTSGCQKWVYTVSFPSSFFNMTLSLCLEKLLMSDIFGLKDSQHNLWICFLSSYTEQGRWSIKLMIRLYNWLEMRNSLTLL